MYIEPNTDIYILKSVPLDNAYKHTIYFADSDEQYNYFIGLKRHGLTKQSYQRVQKGKARVNIKADNLYFCNYMMFRNTAYGTKWFYAFITSVEFINNVVSEISFEIDILQTWMFDYSLKQCYVEREHSSTDEIGDNTLVEPIDIGDIICAGTTKTDKFDSYVAVIATAYNPDKTPGGVVGGLFTGLDYVAGLINTDAQVQTLLDFLQTITDLNKQDSIVSIFIMPTAFWTDEKEPVVEAVKVMPTEDFNGYTPRNKKLLTYPYNFLSVDCGNNSAIYRYEYFRKDADTGAVQFMMNSAITPNPEIDLVPVDYNGTDFNYTEKLTMNGFPQIGYAIDSFRAWIAQEASGQALNFISSAVTASAGFASGNVVAGAIGTIGNAQSLNNIVLAMNRPPQAKGNQGGSVAVATRTKNFYFRFMQVKPSVARIIDDFFDVYGYACCRHKKPNITARPHWNYVKTKDCNATGSVPADDMSKIKSIYDNGITFWMNGNEVGNYSLDNSIQ